MLVRLFSRPLTPNPLSDSTIPLSVLLYCTCTSLHSVSLLVSWGLQQQVRQRALAASGRRARELWQAEGGEQKGWGAAKAGSGALNRIRQERRQQSSCREGKWEEPLSNGSCGAGRPQAWASRDLRPPA